MLKLKASLALLLIGLVFLVAVAISNHQYSYLVKHGVRTTGTIMGCALQENSVPSFPVPNNRSLWGLVSYSTRCYKFEIEFETKTGKKVAVSAGPYVNKLAIAGKVSILYLPDDPEKTAIIEDNSEVALWVIGMMFCTGSGLFFLAACGAKSQPPTPKNPGQLS